MGFHRIGIVPDATDILGLITKAPRIDPAEFVAAFKKHIAHIIISDKTIFDEDRFHVGSDVVPAIILLNMDGHVSDWVSDLVLRVRDLHIYLMVRSAFFNDHRNSDLRIDLYQVLVNPKPARDDGFVPIKITVNEQKVIARKFGAEILIGEVEGIMNVFLNRVEGEVVVHDVFFQETIDVFGRRHVALHPVPVAMNNGVGVILIVGIEVIEFEFEDLATVEADNGQTQLHIPYSELYCSDAWLIGSVLVSEVSVIKVIVLSRRGERDKKQDEKEKRENAAHIGRQR